MAASPVSLLPQRRRARSTVPYHPKKPKRILVVEDEPGMSQLLSEVLRSLGFEALTASNGREGLDMLKSHTIDGIVMDLDMPVMDGCTMLDELRWHGDVTPVVVMSFGTDVPVLRTMLNEGAQGFLVKPFTVETLRTQCTRCFVA